MRALSVKQPWATLIANGDKCLEVRSRNARYRGPVIIVASKSAPTPGGKEAAHRWALDLDELPKGVSLCLVELVDSRPMRREDVVAACCEFDPTAFVWELRNPRALPPIPTRGIPTLFRRVAQGGRETRPVTTHGQPPAL